MKKNLIIIGLVLTICLLLPVSCAPAPAPAPAPIPTPVPIPTPILTNSESDSRIAELEAKIRQLEAENQRLTTENQELNSDLARVTSELQNLYSLVTSSSYTLALDRLTEIQSKTIELSYFAEGLPDLPPLPLGLTISEIDDAINKARDLRRLLELLPPPPPFAPKEWRDLDDMKEEFIRMTKWMENLQDLPGFLKSAESLEDLRSRIENYLAGVHNTTSYAESLMRQVRDAASGY